MRNRVEILNEASQLVDSDRAEQYGDVNDVMECTSKMWNAFITAKGNVNEEEILLREDVCLFILMNKLARIACGKYKRDNYVDVAGYAALAGEIALQGEPNDE